ncbi:hypothetical protein EON80_17120 [bacterium]|nr:MAG: hypothetical protein EON80_17120 [bacterium]
MTPTKKRTDQQLQLDADRKKRAEGIATREVFSEQERDPAFKQNLQRLRAERRKREDAGGDDD